MDVVPCCPRSDHRIAEATSVTKPVPDYLRLYRERSEAPTPVGVDQVTGLSEFFHAFEQATGWSLQYVAGRSSESGAELDWSAPVNPGVGIAPGLLSLGLPVCDDDAIEWEPV